ncbi:MAG TPA: EamA family transporter RarD [Burkholderiaceae bacterium]
MSQGILYAALAFLCWGLFPLYFKTLRHIPAQEIMAHRMVWSLLFLAVVLGVRRHWRWLADVARQPKTIARFAASALLLSSNWLVYTWAVNNDRIVDASLGYFINPLVNVMLGFFILHERMRRAQWLAIGLAACGVAWLTWQAGQFPTIALFLAASFGTYGLLRKTATLGPLEGLSFETLLLFPAAVAYFTWLTVHQQNTFLASSAGTQWMLAAIGPLTAIPLLLFAAGARRIPLTVLGLLQYISPSLQLILGVVVYHEPFGSGKMIGFAFIWGALALYSAEGLWNARRQNAAVIPKPAEAVCNEIA